MVLLCYLAAVLNVDEHRIDEYEIRPYHIYARVDAKSFHVDATEMCRLLEANLFTITINKHGAYIQIQIAPGAIHEDVKVTCEKTILIDATCTTIIYLPDVNFGENELVEVDKYAQIYTYPRYFANGTGDLFKLSFMTGNYYFAPYLCRSVSWS